MIDQLPEIPKRALGFASGNRNHALKKNAEEVDNDGFRPRYDDDDEEEPEEEDLPKGLVRIFLDDTYHHLPTPSYLPLTILSMVSAWNVLYPSKFK